MKRHILASLSLLLLSLGIFAQTAPVVDNPIADQYLDEGFGTTTVDLTNVFSDPNGDPLTLTPTSSDENVVTVSISSNTLTITEVGPGTCNVTVNASDGSESVDDVFLD